MQITENSSTDYNDATTGLLDTEDVARRAKVCERTVTYWRDRKKDPLPHVRLGRAVRFIPEDVEAFIRAHRIGK